MAVTTIFPLKNYSECGGHVFIPPFPTGFAPSSEKNPLAPPFNLKPLVSVGHLENRFYTLLNLQRSG